MALVQIESCCISRAIGSEGVNVWWLVWGCETSNGLFCVIFGSMIAAAEKMAHELAALPQGCLRADRLSAIRQWGLTEKDAMAAEFASLSAVAAESVAGAKRFADGAGRHGSPT